MVKRYSRIGGELVDPKVPVEKRMQLAELLGNWLHDLQDQINRNQGYTTDADEGEPFVIHGDTVPATLPDARLHRDLTGSDLHWPKPHAQSTHPQGGVDPLATSAPVQVGAANAIGSATDYVKSDHVHLSRYVHVWQETPAGAIDGANDTYTFALGTKTFTYDASEIPQVLPAPADWHRVYYVYDQDVIDDASIMVFKNGVLYLDGLGITVSGDLSGSGFFNYPIPILRLSA